MEKEFKIPIPGTKLNIYAKQYGSLDNPVVIFIHGLTGHMDEHMFYNGARFFHEHGISSLRFNLYDYDEDTRNLVDCTLKIHGQDLTVVTDYLRQKGVSKLFAIGHSYGGPTILFAEHSKLDAAVFWDASFNYQPDDAKPLPGTKYRYLDWGIWHLIGDDMYQEARELEQEKLFDNFTTPLKVITAGKEFYEERKKNYELAKGPKEYHHIPDAGHTFSEEGKAEELFEESISWLKKFI